MANTDSLYLTQISGHSSVKAEELLKIGSESQEVYDVQSKLKKIGYFPVKPTGYFGTCFLLAKNIERFTLYFFAK